MAKKKNNEENGDREMTLQEKLQDALAQFKGEKVTADSIGRIKGTISGVLKAEAKVTLNRDGSITIETQDGESITVNN